MIRKILARSICWVALAFVLMVVQQPGSALSAVKIAKIDPVNMSIKQGAVLKLPRTVTAKLSTGAKSNVAVVWNNTKVDTSKVGKIKIFGDVKGYSKKVELYVTIEKYILSIDNLEFLVKQNDSFSMPQTVKCNMSDSTVEERSVSWDNQLSSSAAGEFSAAGSVVGYDNKVGIKLKVETYIDSIADMDITVVQEDKFDFPQTLKAKMSDGTEVDVPVKWNSTDLDTNQVGKYTFIGEVEGYKNRPVLTVTVKSNKLTIQQISAFRNAVVSVVTLDHHGNRDGSGSGFLVSKDGILVTCYHVIDGDQDCIVTLENGKKYLVDSVLNASKEKDIAVLKLKDAVDMPFVKLGNSDKTQIGDDIVAIGNPQGYQNTVTGGRVSGLNRKSDLRTGNDIQFDAGITSGSSGGALFNMKGEIIGMTYSGYDTGNLNFAIPSNDITPFLTGGTPTTLAALNPLTDDEIYELKLEKLFSSYKINDKVFTISDIYLTMSTKSNTVYIDMYYDNEEYDKFMSAMFNGTPGEIANNRSLYEQWLRGVYSEVKSHYPNKTVIGYIDGFKVFNDKPSEKDFPDIELDKETGKWDAYVTLTVFGDDTNGFGVYWRQSK